MQLEEEKFVFKVVVDKENENERKEIREFYRNYLYKKAKELDIDISQYGRLGSYMGAAILNSEYRITNKNGLLNFQATVNNLKGMEKLMNETGKEMQMHITKQKN